MSFSNIKKYNDAFLDNISSSDLEKLVENCFTSKTKNYELLAKLTARLVLYQLCPLNHAIKILEEKAVEIMLANFNNDAIKHIKQTPYITDNIWNQIEAPLPYNMSMSTKKEKILNIADQILALKENITQIDLQNYAKIAPLAKFTSLIFEKKVNLAEMNLSFPPQYEVEKYKPLLKGSNYASIEDILLTHTYAYDKNITEVRAIYTNLLNNNSNMASSAINYTAINIIKGDDVKIFFGPETKGFVGGYIPLLNMVIVNPAHGKFTSEAIAIHELSHYTLCNLNPNTGCAPFDLSKLKFLSSTQDDLYGYHINQQLSEDKQEVKFFKEVKDDANIFSKYEQAAKPVIVKAGQLLGLSEESFTPYVFSKDFILHLKDNSLIDLFYTALILPHIELKVMDYTLNAHKEPSAEQLAVLLEKLEEIIANKAKHSGYQELSTSDLERSTEDYAEPTVEPLAALHSSYFKDNGPTLSQRKAFAEAYYQYTAEFYPGQSPNKGYEHLREYYQPCPIKLSAEYISNLRFDDQASFVNQVAFVQNYYLPYYQQVKMNLSNNQIWFLERIADLVNREKDIYDIASSYYGSDKPNYHQYYVELIVRYPELKASGMDQDILDSFAQLVQFYDDYVLPEIRGQVDSILEQKCLHFHL